MRMLICMPILLNSIRYDSASGQITLSGEMNWDGIAYGITISGKNTWSHFLYNVDKADLSIVFTVETNAETGTSRLVINGVSWSDFVWYYNNGKSIKAVFEDGGVKAELTSIYYNSTSGTAIFTGAIGSSITPQSVLVVWDSNDNLDYTIESGGTVTDVRVNGHSVLTDGVANIPVASANTVGVAKFNGNDYGVSITNNGDVYIHEPNDTKIKAGTNAFAPITTRIQDKSVFYGLAKAAGDTTQSQSANAVGQYTDTAKSAIQTMLGVEPGVVFVEEVTGTTPTITGIANTRYICGEVSTIDITPPAIGTIDVRFTSGATAAVLTVPSTVKFPDWFDATALEASTTYEIIITDGTFAGVMAWAE